MRQKLNENPVAQIILVAVLLLVAGFFLLSQLGGGESEEAETVAAPPAAGTESAGVELAPAAATSSVSAPAARRLPRDVEDAYERGETVVLLIFRPGGIDDNRVAAAARAVADMPGVALFEAPTREIALYSSITGPLGINQAPALIVIRSRRFNHGDVAPATVSYGFQNARDVAQAIVDSGYRGPELSYAPR